MLFAMRGLYAAICILLLFLAIPDVDGIQVRIKPKERAPITIDDTFPYRNPWDGPRFLHTSLEEVSIDPESSSSKFVASQSRNTCTGSDNISSHRPAEGLQCRNTGLMTSVFVASDFSAALYGNKKPLEFTMRAVSGRFSGSERAAQQLEKYPFSVGLREFGDDTARGRRALPSPDKCIDNPRCDAVRPLNVVVDHLSLKTAYSLKLIHTGYPFGVALSNFTFNSTAEGGESRLAPEVAAFPLPGPCEGGTVFLNSGSGACNSKIAELLWQNQTQPDAATTNDACGEYSDSPGPWAKNTLCMAAACGPCDEQANSTVFHGSSFSPTCSLWDIHETPDFLADLRVRVTPENDTEAVRTVWVRNARPGTRNYSEDRLVSVYLENFVHSPEVSSAGPRLSGKIVVCRWTTEPAHWNQPAFMDQDESTNPWPGSSASAKQFLPDNGKRAPVPTASYMFDYAGMRLEDVAESDTGTAPHRYMWYYIPDDIAESEVGFDRRCGHNGATERDMHMNGDGWFGGPLNLTASCANWTGGGIALPTNVAGGQCIPGYDDSSNFPTPCQVSDELNRWSVEWGAETNEALKPPLPVHLPPGWNPFYVKNLYIQGDLPSDEGGLGGQALLEAEVFTDDDHNFDDHLAVLSPTGGGNFWLSVLGDRPLNQSIRFASKLRPASTPALIYDPLSSLEASERLREMRGLIRIDISEDLMPGIGGLSAARVYALPDHSSAPFTSPETVGLYSLVDGVGVIQVLLENAYTTAGDQNYILSLSDCSVTASGIYPFWDSSIDIQPSRTSYFPLSDYDYIRIGHVQAGRVSRGSTPFLFGFVNTTSGQRWKLLNKQLDIRRRDPGTTKLLEGEIPFGYCKLLVHDEADTRIVLSLDPAYRIPLYFVQSTLGHKPPMSIPPTIYDDDDDDDDDDFWDEQDEKDNANQAWIALAFIFAFVLFAAVLLGTVALLYQCVHSKHARNTSTSSSQDG